MDATAMASARAHDDRGSRSSDSEYPRSDGPDDGRTGQSRRPLTIAGIALVLILYALSAVLSAGPSDGSDFHRRAAAAMADGHLDIRPVPDALRSLTDPYDAAANLDTRLHDDVQDLAYRNGRLYSAHGLTVPLLLLPFEVTTGTSPPNWVITLIGGWVGFLAGVTMLTRARRHLRSELPDWASASVVVAFGLCGPTWVLMSSGNGYEAAIAIAFAFTMAGAALLFRAADGLPHLRRPSAAAGSVCLGLAVGARPTAIVAGIAVAVVAIATVRSARRRSAGEGGPTRMVGDLAAVLVPYGAVMVVLAGANLARFGSPTEFGFGYQLSVWNMTTYPIGRASYLGPNLADYLFAIPRVSSRFPWFRLRGTIGGDSPAIHTAEPIIGLVFLAPVLVVGLASLVRGFASMRRGASSLAVATVTAVTVGLTTLVAVSLPFNTSTLRYAVDGAPMLVLAACGGWMWSWSPSRSTDTGGPHRLDLAWITGLAIGVAVTASVQVPF